MDVLSYGIEHAIAGLWAQVWHWGVGIGLIVICLAGAFFSTSIPLIGPYLENTRKDLLWAAFVIAVFLAGQFLGAHDADRRNAAQQIVVEERVDTVVEKTKTPKARARSDKWDRPEY